jgi:hypothetical protein
MKATTLRAVIGIVGLLTSAQPGHPQGTFANLDFESTSLSGPPQLNVPADTALPGWSAFIYTPSFGTTVLSTVWYDEVSLGGAAISLMDANIALGLTPLQGTYSVLLTGGGSIPRYSAGISQTGLVPVGARTLLIDILTSPFQPPFTVTLGGETISMVAEETFPGYTRYGGDITSLGGQVAALTISQPPAAGLDSTGIELDNIKFSNEPIPEPNVLGLLAVGAAILGRELRRRSR